MKAPEMTAQVIMMRAIQTRAPTRCKITLLGHLEQEVAEEKHACAQAIHGFAELQVIQHLQLGKADVDPVQVGHDIAKHQERHDAPGDLAIGGSFFREGIRRCFLAWNGERWGAAHACLLMVLRGTCLF
jgi:hypothetical protein